MRAERHQPLTLAVGYGYNDPSLTLPNVKVEGSSPFTRFASHDPASCRVVVFLEAVSVRSTGSESGSGSGEGLFDLVWARASENLAAC